MNIHQELAKIVKKQFLIGCGNHSCRFKKVVGQGTNGPCGCAGHIAGEITQFILKNEAKWDDQFAYYKSACGDLT